MYWNSISARQDPGTVRRDLPIPSSELGSALEGPQESAAVLDILDSACHSLVDSCINSGIYCPGYCVISSSKNADVLDSGDSPGAATLTKSHYWRSRSAPRLNVAIKSRSLIWEGQSKDRDPSARTVCVISDTQNLVVRIGRKIFIRQP